MKPEIGDERQQFLERIQKEKKEFLRKLLVRLKDEDAAAASTAEPPTLDQILDVVTALFRKSDTAAVTVGDIVRDVEAQFGIAIEKPTKKKIKAHLTELVVSAQQEDDDEEQDEEEDDEEELELRLPEPEEHEEKVKIHFDRYKIDEEEIIPIINALGGYANLRQLQLCWHNVTVPALEILGNFIGEHKQLECLILRGNTIYCEELVPIAQGIGKNSSLLIVDLKDNNFDKKGAVALADALKVNKTLKRLNLHNNFIYNDGAEALADALAVNKTLESLTLTRNGVEEEGYRNFATSLSSNTLKELDLHYFEFGRTGLVLQTMIKYNNMDVSEDERKKLKDGVEGYVDAMSSDEQMRHLTLSFLSGM